MAKLAIKKGKTDVTLNLFIQDSSASTGAGLTGLAYNTASLACYYIRPGGSATAISLATQTVTGAHSDGGFVEIDSTNMPGWYRLDIPDAVVATGVDHAGVTLQGAADMSPCNIELQLDKTNDDLNDISVANILAGTIEGSYDLQDVLKIMAAVLAGEVSGGGTTTITFRNLGDTLNRVVATVDSQGNRTAFTYNLS